MDGDDQLRGQLIKIEKRKHESETGNDLCPQRKVALLRRSTIIPRKLHEINTYGLRMKRIIASYLWYKSDGTSPHSSSDVYFVGRIVGARDQYFRTEG